MCYVLPMITHSFVKELLHYDPETGIFRWKVALTNSVGVGLVAGTLGSRGYWHIRIGGTTYASHRLAWFYVHGEWPTQVIDHIDRDRSNNRIANLRDVSLSDNNRNRTVKEKTKSHKPTEVAERVVKGFDICFRKDRKRWRARLSIGCYGSKEEAEQTCAKYMKILEEGLR